MSVTITGIIITIFSQFLPAEEVGILVNAVVTIIGILLAWWGRYRIGDITWYGARK